MPTSGTAAGQDLRSQGLEKYEGEGRDTVVGESAICQGRMSTGERPAEDLLMQCIHCKGRLERGVAAFSVDRRGYHVHWDAVPAWVCTQCGEPLFEARKVDLIQHALVALDRDSAKLIAAS